MSLPAPRRMRLSGGTELAYVTAGDPSDPALLLLHGFPSSARAFRDVLPGLARAAYVIAPDLPGQWPVRRSADALLCGVQRRDFRIAAPTSRSGAASSMCMTGAPRWGCRSPCKRPSWFRASSSRTRTRIDPASALCGTPPWRFWAEPTKENEAAATVHLTFEFTRAVRGRAAGGCRRHDRGRTLGRGLEGDDSSRPHGNPPRAHRRLLQATPRGST